MNIKIVRSVIYTAEGPETKALVASFVLFDIVRCSKIVNHSQCMKGARSVVLQMSKKTKKIGSD